MFVSNAGWEFVDPNIESGDFFSISVPETQFLNGKWDKTSQQWNWTMVLRCRLFLTRILAPNFFLIMLDCLLWSSAIIFEISVSYLVPTIFLKLYKKNNHIKSKLAKFCLFFLRIPKSFRRLFEIVKEKNRLKILVQMDSPSKINKLICISKIFNWKWKYSMLFLTM